MKISIASDHAEFKYKSALISHQAILFGLLGSFLCQPLLLSPPCRQLPLQQLSFQSHLFLFGIFVGGYNGAIQRVIIAAIIAAICLLVTTVLTILDRSN
ncbi:MAG: hypothetical protein AAF902_23865 [Chloroflexota bacterium]